jgi:hypothetical protein
MTVLAGSQTAPASKRGARLGPLGGVLERETEVHVAVRLRGVGADSVGIVARHHGQIRIGLVPLGITGEHVTPEILRILFKNPLRLAEGLHGVAVRAAQNVSIEVMRGDGGAVLGASLEEADGIGAKLQNDLFGGAAEGDVVGVGGKCRFRHGEPGRIGRGLCEGAG